MIPDTLKTKLQNSLAWAGFTGEIEYAQGIDQLSLQPCINMVYVNNGETTPLVSRLNLEAIQDSDIMHDIEDEIANMLSAEIIYELRRGNPA